MGNDGNVDAKAFHPREDILLAFALAWPRGEMDVGINKSHEQRIEERMQKAMQ